MRSAKASRFQGIRSICGILFIGLTLRWGLAEAYVIPSGSMQPTLLVHDHILVNKLAYGVRLPFSTTWIASFKNPERGDVIVFKDPRNTDVSLIKRVVGLPGDKIEYRNRQIFINDQKIPLFQESTDLGAIGLVEDPDGDGASHRVLVEQLGDQSYVVLHSEDHFEGDFGPIEVPQGELFMMGDHRDNSSDSRSWGFAPRENILGKAMFVWLSCEEALVGIAGCDPTTLRWNRFLHPIQ